MHDKAALLSIMRKTSPKTLSKMMTANKTFHEVGTVAMKLHMNDVKRLKERVRAFVRRVQADDVYLKTPAARFRKLALVAKAKELGVTNHLRPIPRAGFMGKALGAPPYMNRKFVKDLGLITPSRFPFKTTKR